MQYNHYIGHESQLYGVEEHRLIGGKGDGMRLLEVRNGLGLECVVMPDRCADIYRLTYMGRNMCFFSPCGYVAPSYYEKEKTGWFSTFTAGFLTTCGLTQIGSPCEDMGEVLPLHGNIGNLPAEHIWWYREKNEIVVQAEIRDASLLGHKLMLHRKLCFSTTDNSFTLTDTVENHADTKCPILILYHMNMGYPLLSEKAELQILSDSVFPTENSEESHLQILPPTAGYQEKCYVHSFTHKGLAKLFNPEIGLGLSISFDTQQLPCFCQWKKMGIHDYVLGLEPGNSVNNRADSRKNGTLEYLQPGEEKNFGFTVRFFSNYDAWQSSE